MLILFAAFLSVIFLFGAAAVDYGLWLSERRGLARAADFAALAAAQDLPPTVTAPPAGIITKTEDCDLNKACENAFTWAHRNGYGTDQGATVEVSFFCGNSLPVAVPGICVNENAGRPPFFLSPCPNSGGEIGCDAINVSVHKPAVALFSQFFGGVSFDIGYSSWGRVSFKLVPQDTVMAIDVTGSMGGPSANPCPLPLPATKLGAAQCAANHFTDILLNGTNSLSQVGLAPYNHCYNPPLAGLNCVPAAHGAGSNALDPTCQNPPAAKWEICLKKDPVPVKDKIKLLTASGNTNVCLGLLEASAMLSPAVGASSQANAQRFIVLLTDGDNNYSSGAYNLALNSPPPQCRPANPTTNDSGNSCNSAAGAHEKDLDLKTKALAATIKASAVHTEIYVIALAPCTNNSNSLPTTAYCNGIGNADPDTIADRRLTKCIASSSPGTNDHYLESPTAAQLDTFFKQVAYEIGGRGLVAGTGS